MYEELTGVNDEISDLEDRLASLKDRANTLGKDYMKAKRESEAADKAVSVSAPALGCAVGLQFDLFVLGTRLSYLMINALVVGSAWAQRVYLGFPQHDLLVLLTQACLSNPCFVAFPVSLRSF